MFPFWPTARKRVQSGAAGQCGRSRAGCLVGYIPGHGHKPDDVPLGQRCTALLALVVGPERLLPLAACRREFWRLQ